MQFLLFYGLTVLIWGSTWYAITFQLGAAAESVSLLYRFSLAALLLFIYCLVSRKPMRFSLTEHAYMAGQGFTLFSVNYLLFYWCTRYLTSGLVAVIFSTVIVMNIFNGALFLKRRVRPVVLLGALFGLIGISLLFADEIVDSQTAQQSAMVWRGLSLGIIATFCASLGNILSARNQSAGLPIVQSNAYGMAYGSLVMLIYAVMTGASFRVDWSISYASSLVYLSIFGSIIAFGAYLSLIGRYGADRAAYASVLFPLVALVISSVFEDYRWTPMAIMGVALVLFGNVLVLGRKALAKLYARVRESALGASQ